MEKYFAFMKLGIKENITYSKWYWTEFLTIVLRILFIIFFWQYLFFTDPNAFDLSLDIMVNYSVVTILMQSFTFGIGESISRAIKNGDIVHDLTKPYNTIAKYIFLNSGSMIMNFIKLTVPTIIVISLVFNAQYLTSSNIVCSILSIIFGIMIGVAIDTLIGLLAFTTVSVVGLSLFSGGVLLISSGALVPLTLYPEWFQSLSQYLPLQYISYVPAGIYSGIITNNEQITFYIIVQLFWVVLLFILIRVIFKSMQKHVMIFGG
ncbi:hypothetical protein FZX01_03690 [Listeria monocytogenes]|uniref:ABC transporter permease n=1 Tax=Listeria monocytogenes TaxID=1639 RepID=UPI0011EB763C|nr:ABC-2 family transporter protein [Listeria monocytogenes]EHY0679234.1 ABC-2 family transporter protein [Listeria monocytogenes]TYU88625.1 hypothetical protein FZX01_03690 [Listeria monocytogenes]